MAIDFINLLKNAMEIYGLGPKEYLQKKGREAEMMSERAFQSEEAEKERKGRFNIAKLGLQKISGKEQYIKELTGIPDEQRTPEQKQHLEILRGVTKQPSDKLDELTKIKYQSLQKRLEDPFVSKAEKELIKQDIIKIEQGSKQELLPQTSEQKIIRPSRSELIKAGHNLEEAKKKLEAQGFTVIFTD